MLDMPSEPCLLLCLQTTFLALAFADQAFKAPGLTSPDTVFKFGVSPGANELRLVWEESMVKQPIFRQSEHRAKAFGFPVANPGRTGP